MVVPNLAQHALSEGTHKPSLKGESMAKGKSEAQTAATAAAERAEESLRRAIGGNSGVKPPSKDAAFKALDAAFLNEASVDERLGKRRDGITKDKRAATEKTIF